MAKLGQFCLHEQYLGTRILRDPIRKISRHRIPLGSEVKKSLMGHSFPKTGQYKKEITYQNSNGAQQRKRYRVYFIPYSPKYDTVWQLLRDAWAAWWALDPSKKQDYNDRADRKATLSGFNLFIGEYIHAHI